MASVKDTATFFLQGTSSQFEHVLSLYPQALRLKAERKTKKPEELIRLDNWYQNELPQKIKSRGKDAHLIHEELVQTMKWKQARGKFYPQLSYLVKVNTPRAVIAETKKAFRKLPNLEQAMTALSNLKGVGTTMASALLAAASPETAPFMADECLMAIPEIEGIDYTAKEYLNFVQHIKSAAERLNKDSDSSPWSPHRVELAIWTHYIVSEIQPELLSDLPSVNGSNPKPEPVAVSGVVHQNGDSIEASDESNQGTMNGNKPPTVGLADEETTSTSFTEDSMDKPATPITANDETNDSVASESTCDSATPAAPPAAAAEAATEPATEAPANAAAETAVEAAAETAVETAVEAAAEAAAVDTTRQQQQPEEVKKKAEEELDGVQFGKRPLDEDSSSSLGAGPDLKKVCSEPQADQPPAEEAAAPMVVLEEK